MNEISEKVERLISKINHELYQLGSDTIAKVGSTVTEDTNEKYATVVFEIGAAEFLTYGSSNSIGIKTYLQGVLAILQLATGNYRFKPLNEMARKRVPEPILPRLPRDNDVGVEHQRQKKNINPRNHPRLLGEKLRFS